MQNVNHSLKLVVGLAVAATLILGYWSYRAESDKEAKAAKVASAKAEADVRAQKEAHEAQVIRDQQIAASNRLARIKQDADKAAAEAQSYLNRYVIASRPKKAGVRTLAVAVVTDAKTPNRTFENALASHFKNDTTEVTPSFFTQAFYSDGLFESVFAGSGDVSKRLQLASSLDAALLARYRVECSSPDQALAGIITATSSLEVSLVPFALDITAQTPTFTAKGAGMDRESAKKLADERLLKQIADDTKMTLK